VTRRDSISTTTRLRSSGSREHDSTTSTVSGGSGIGIAVSIGSVAGNHSGIGSTRTIVAIDRRVKRSAAISGIRGRPSAVANDPKET